ncbi:MAG: bacillithiol system redox-active protein YtxJ [Bacteroidota bacterium]
MGLFGKAFRKDNGNKEELKKIPWVPLDALEQLQTIKERSQERPQLIFKHSKTCGISGMVLNRFTQYYEIPLGDADLYFLDLLANRNISDAVASQFGVVHQSPQLLIIKEGETLLHASHGAISDIDLSKAQW